MTDIVSSKALIKSKQQYDELGETKYDYDCILVSDAALAKVILQDQCINSQKLQWVHSLLVGIDVICSVEEFKLNDSIILTNAKGAFSESLAEFIIYSILQTTQPNKFGNDSSVQLLEKLTVGIIGYGDIGFQCARMINKLLKMKVVGLKRSPQNTTQEHSDQVDEIIGFDSLDYLLAKSDFVVNCLPYTKETHELFDMRLFQKMKPTSVYVNIGRGQTGNENDLIKALQDKIIRAASLDVFYQEPLPADSPLWDMDNVIMTPHCADLTDDYHQRSMDIFIRNLQRYQNHEQLNNICNKALGY
eukprot:403368774